MATALSSTGSIATAPFRVGQTERYLPKFTIALLRHDHLGANHARFSVPLWFSKLDLRDYLYHAYNVRIFRITSFVQQQRVSADAKDVKKEHIPTGRKWHRPRARKFMTVQLERPFVWPKEPEDFTAWDRDKVKERVKDILDTTKLRSATGDTIVNEKRRESMKEQAKMLLEGKERWKPATNDRSVGQMVSLRR